MPPCGDRSSARGPVSIGASSRHLAPHPPAGPPRQSGATASGRLQPPRRSLREPRTGLRAAEDHQILVLRASAAVPPARPDLDELEAGPLGDASHDQRMVGDREQRVVGRRVSAAGVEYVDHRVGRGRRGDGRKARLVPQEEGRHRDATGPEEACHLAQVMGDRPPLHVGEHREHGDGIERPLAGEPGRKRVKQSGRVVALVPDVEVMEAVGRRERGQVLAAPGDVAGQDVETLVAPVEAAFKEPDREPAVPRADVEHGRTGTRPLQYEVGERDGDLHESLVGFAHEPHARGWDRHGTNRWCPRFRGRRSSASVLCRVGAVHGRSMGRGALRDARSIGPAPVLGAAYDAAMVDFTLSDENRLVQQSARAFAEAEILPHIREWDEKGEVHREVFARMGDLGFLGAPIPEAYGGSGMDYLSFAILCEELERADTSFRVVQSVHVGLNSLALLQWGTDEQRRRWLVPQARGEKLATFGLTEPGVGTDAANLATTARRDGEIYRLNGQKIWISLADLADHFLVFASVDRAKKHKGVTAFMLERGMAGLTTGTLHGKLGIRAGNTGLINLDDVPVPIANRIGEEGEGFLIAMSAIDQGRFTVAAGAVGLAQACLDASVRYAHERHTFGQEIGEHQLVKQLIAKMAAGTEMGRLLVWRAGWLKNQGLRNTRETSLAKWHATEHAVQSALDAIQVHGANGYSNEFPVERYLRNSKAAVIYEGTSQLHTLIQADYALGYREDRPLRCEPWPAQGWERPTA